MRLKLEHELNNIIKNKFNIESNIKLEIPDIAEYGDFSLPCFQFAKEFKKAPPIIATEIKSAIEENNLEYIKSIENIGPYLNLKLDKTVFFNEIFNQVKSNAKDYGHSNIGENQTIMVEFSSPNTNKPLHLGHVRNNLLGDSVSRLHNACGFKVIKSNLLNDRGIHICKAMLAYKEHGNNETPESSGLKGDHLIGKYYVIFEKKLKEELDNYLIEKNIDLSKMDDREKDKFMETEFYPNSKYMSKTREMLINWENGDKETLELWKKLNDWVFNGFEETYKNLGISFDKYYYESDTYKLGKEYVLKGLETGACYQNDDGSVWLKLPKKGFNNDKIMLRKDGTSLYITQDVGTAFLKYDDYKMDKSVYVVGSEQDYQFQVLFKALELLGFEKYKGCYHLSYGMVYLPEGKMKSREGKVVDADDLILGMQEKAQEEIVSRNRPFEKNELKEISNIVGLGALKYFILQFSAKSDFTFDPQASIDFNGKTGPYIQYTHARISSLLKQVGEIDLNNIDFSNLNSNEDYSLLRLIEQFQNIVEKACLNYNTSILADYLYNVASAFNSFYSKSDNKIKDMELDLQKPRIALSYCTKIVLNNGLELLGIKAPEQM